MTPFFDTEKYATQLKCAKCSKNLIRLSEVIIIVIGLLLVYTLCSYIFLNILLTYNYEHHYDQSAVPVIEKSHVSTSSYIFLI